MSVLDRSMFRRGYATGGLATLSESGAISPQQRAVGVIDELLQRQPAEAPDLRELTEENLPLYQEMLGAGGEDAKRAARANILFGLAEAGLNFAGGVGPGGQPMRGSTVSQLTQSLSGIPSLVAEQSQELRRGEQQARLAALQGAISQREAAEKADRARDAIRYQVASKLATMTGEKPQIFGDPSTGYFIVDEDGQAQMLVSPAESEEAPTTLSTGHMNRTVAQHTPDILRGVENVTDEDLTRFIHSVNVLTTERSEELPDGTVTVMPAIELTEPQLRALSLAEAEFSRRFPEDPAAATAPRAVEEDVAEAGAPDPSSLPVLPSMADRIQSALDDPLGYDVERATGVRGALRSARDRGLGALGLPAMDPANFEAAAALNNRATEILGHLREVRGGRIFAAEIERMEQELPSPGTVREPPEDVAARLSNYYSVLEKEWDRNNIIANDPDVRATPSERREADRAQKAAESAMHELARILVQFPSWRGRKLQEIDWESETSSPAEAPSAPPTRIRWEDLPD